MKIKSWILVICTSFPLGLFAETLTYEAKGLTQVEVNNLSGISIVQATANPLASVQIDKINWDEDCHLVTQNMLGILKIEVEDKSSQRFLKKGCQANIVVSVPESVDSKVKSGSGELKIMDMSGRIQFHLGSGQVKVKSSSAEIRGLAGSGDIEIEGKADDLQLRTGSGNVSVNYTEAVPEGSMDIKTGTGNATLFFPRSMKVLADYKAGSGSLSTEFGYNKDAKFKVSMRAGSGSLRIKKRESKSATR